MEIHCDTCSKILAEHVGMALLQPPCVHSSIYEHFTDFQNYIKNKEEDETIRDLNQFSTGDILRYRHQLRMGKNDRLFLALPLSPKPKKVPKPQNIRPEASKLQTKSSEKSKSQTTLSEPQQKSQSPQKSKQNTSKPPKVESESPRTHRILYEIPKIHKKLQEGAYPQRILYGTPKLKKAVSDVSRPQNIFRKKVTNDKVPKRNYPKLSRRLVVRTPVNCAISSCNQIVGVTALLTHYVRDHSEDYGIQCQEIIPERRSMLIFDPTNLVWRESVCLGVLAYGGKDRKSCPAERGICAHNSFLPSPYENMDAHLPILIMANRTSWASFFGNTDDEKRYSNPNDRAQEMIVIWFSSVKVTRPLHCIVTVFNKQLTACRSHLLRVRNLYESQNPSEFVSNDADCLRLSHSDIKVFSQNFTESIYLEMFIHEYEEQREKQ